MKRVMKWMPCLLLVMCSLTWAQVGALRPFPDVPGYQTLICDFHMHTVFSDGQVWPNVRVDEAYREGIDVIALSDHIEYQPHKDDLPTNHNRPFEIAINSARQKNVLLIKGAEITHSTPPGHYNAIFLSDIDPLVHDEILEQVDQANQQDGFVFWNHHTWKGEDKGQWEDLQTFMHEKKWLKGMEVANGSVYYPLAHQWCLDKGMTMMGNSDIHVPSINYQYTAQQHRTLTLVFARERSIASVQEALKAGRTVVWHNNMLIGRADVLAPLFKACVEVKLPHQVTKKQARFEVSNQGLIDLEMKYTMPGFTKTVTLPARSRIIATVPLTEDGNTSIDLVVNNLLVAPNQGLPVHWELAERLTIE